MSDPAAPAAEWQGPKSNKTFLGHPIGLFVLFMTEMSERFSYYGMRGLLKLYMVNYLFVGTRQVLQGKAYDGTGNPSDILGWSWIQGLLPRPAPEQIAECISSRAGVLMKGDAANNIAALSADAANQIAQQVCMVAPSASVLYGWYTGLVYLTPVLGGIIADRYLGQRKTVFIGGALMAIGHFIMAFENAFFIALMFLIVGNGGFKPNISTQVGGLYAPGDKRRDGAFTIFYMGINLGAFLCNLVCGTLAAVYGWHYGFAAAGVVMVLGLFFYTIGQSYLAPDSLSIKKAAAATAVEEKLTPAEWKRVFALMGMCALVIVFWAVYEQQGNTMQTWADEQTNWPAFMASSTWFQSMNPAFIFILAPLLDMLWRWQDKKGKAPSSVTKMAIGSLMLGASFIVMIIGAQVVGTGKGSWFWPTFCTLLITVAELYLSPIGLSLVTKVSPARIVSMMMGFWFLANFFGNLLSGYIGTLYTYMAKESFFAILTAMGICAGLAMFAFIKPLKKAMGAHADV